MVRRLTDDRPQAAASQLYFAPKVADASIQEIVAVFGQPVAGNPTQFMMERALAQAGLDWRYLTLEVAPELLGDAIRGMRAMGFRGCNLTKPHKVAVIEFLDRLAESAEICGAVNCVVREGAKLVGENTDGKGFLQSLEEVTPAAGKDFVILGAGGAARAIAVEVARAGAAHITVVNRSADRGQQLVELLRTRTSAAADFVLWQGGFEVPAGTNVLVNATSIGLKDADARVPIAIKSLRPDLIVADVNFNPPDTRLVRDARERGCTTLSGLGMLVNQAVIAFELWTGIRPDRTAMSDALEEFLGF